MFFSKNKIWSLQARVFVFLFLFCSVLFVNAAQIEAITLQEQIGAQVNALANADPEKVPADPRLIIAGIIQVLLSLMGIIFISLIVAAGYWRLTAQGEEDRLKKSAKTLQGAVIGLIVVMMGYAITQFIVGNIYKATNEPEKVSPQGPFSPPPQDSANLPT